MSTVFSIRGDAPLVFSDGRPFASDPGAQAARTLPVPLPGTTAGMLRTHLGPVSGDWNRQVRGAPVPEVAGPLLALHGRIVYPAPADAVVYEGDKGVTGVMRLLPADSAEGCDLPDGLVPLEVPLERKPAEGYRYWPADVMDEWLVGRDVVPPDVRGPMPEERMHAGIDPETGKAEDGRLFSTTGLCFGDEPADLALGDARGGNDGAGWSLLARVGSRTASAGAAFYGGERRLAYLERVSPDAWPACPPAVRDALKDATRVRLVLATPAVFEAGWRPSWLLEGLGLTMKLRAAAVKRREFVSGWSYSAKLKGPKPVRWLVPAGSVFFLEVTSGSAEALADAWLSPVSDHLYDRRDGYGLALWGTW